MCDHVTVGSRLRSLHIFIFRLCSHVSQWRIQGVGVGVAGRVGRFKPPLRKKIIILFRGFLMIW